MSDLEQTAIERLKAASDMSLRLFEKPLVITYSGGKDSDVLLHLAEKSGMADCDSKKLCVMPYSQFELKRPEPPEVENAEAK